jgi:hypothetical protein
MMGKAALRRTRWRRWPCCPGHDGNPKDRVTRSAQRAWERRAWRGDAGLHVSAHTRVGRGHGW